MMLSLIKSLPLLSVHNLFTHSITVYGISENIDTALTISTFQQAFSLRGSPSGVVFHSDQGVQYTAFEFRKLLKANGITQSFSAPGSPYDNAVAESFFASIKKRIFAAITTGQWKSSRRQEMPIFCSTTITARISGLAALRQTRRKPNIAFRSKHNKMPTATSSPKKTVQFTVGIPYGTGQHYRCHSGIPQPPSRLQKKFRFSSARVSCFFENPCVPPSIISR